MERLLTEHVLTVVLSGRWTTHSSQHLDRESYLLTVAGFCANS